MADKDRYMLNIDNPDLSLNTEIVVHQKLSKDWTWDYSEDKSSWGPALILWLVASGQGTLQVNEKSYNVQRGCFFALPTRGHVYKGRQDLDHPLELSWILFEAKRGDEILDIRGIADLPICFHFSQTEFGLSLMNRILISAGKQREFWLRSFLDEATRQYRSSSQLKSSIDILAEEMTKDPGRFKGLVDMQEFYPASRDHLIRQFRQRFSVTPHEYLIQARIDQARTYLSFSSLPLGEIARLLGYADQFSFSKQFKKRIGVSPREFRRPVKSI